MFVTALYSFRMYFLVFHGKERFRGPKHPESPMGIEAARRMHMIRMVTMHTAMTIMGTVMITHTFRTKRRGSLRCR